jgi:hypothetical protein
MYFHSFRRARAIIAACDPARGTHVPDLWDRLRPRVRTADAKASAFTRPGRATALLRQWHLLSHRRHWQGKDNDGKEDFQGHRYSLSSRGHFTVSRKGGGRLGVETRALQQGRPKLFSLRGVPALRLSDRGKSRRR